MRAGPAARTCTTPKVGVSLCLPLQPTSLAPPLTPSHSTASAASAPPGTTALAWSPWLGEGADARTLLALGNRAGVVTLWAVPESRWRPRGLLARYDCVGAHTAGDAWVTQLAFAPSTGTAATRSAVLAVALATGACQLVTAEWHPGDKRVTTTTLRIVTDGTTHAPLDRLCWFQPTGARGLMLGALAVGVLLVHDTHRGVTDTTETAVSARPLCGPSARGVEDTERMG